MKRILIFSFVLGLAVGLAMPLSGTAAQKTKITIGAAISTTGKFSTNGMDSFRGTELWVDEVKAKGGIFVKDLGKRLPIESLIYDDKSDASTCAKMYERLITVDKVDLLLPPWGSGASFSVTAVTEKHKYPMVLGSAGSEKLFERGFNYIFETAILTKTNADIPPDFFATRKDEFKKVAVIFENFLFTISLKDFTEKKLKEHGLDIALLEMYSPGATDFSSILVKAKAVNPDALKDF